MDAAEAVPVQNHEKGYLQSPSDRPFKFHLQRQRVSTGSIGNGLLLKLSRSRLPTKDLAYILKQRNSERHCITQYEELPALAR
jgi:hypothetical protein